MADELLYDPGFEGALDNWIPTHPAVVAHSGDSVAVYSGAQSMRVDYLADGTAGVATLVGGLELNRTYRISAWMFCPQDSDSLAPAIRVSYDDLWKTAPLTWADHPEPWTNYTLSTSSRDDPFEAGIWTLREVIFVAARPQARVLFYNAFTAVAGQSFNVDQASVTVDEPRVPEVYCELASEWVTVPVINVIGENFSLGLQSYREVETWEPDRITPIDPATYDGIKEDYATYNDIMSSASYVTQVVRVDPNGLEYDLQYTMPIPIEHGGFRLIDVEAPIDVYFYYKVWLDTGEVMFSQPCIVPAYTIADFAGMQCSAVLLSDPLIASQAMWVGLQSIDALNHPGRRELFDVISRRYPVGLSDIRQAPRTTIRMITKTLEQRSNYLALVGSGRVLLMRIPSPLYPEAYCYLSIGDISEERIIHFDHRRPERRWVMEVALVERPHGLVSFTSNRNYNDVLSFEPDGVTPITPMTYQGVIFDYADYTAVLTGTNTQIVAPPDNGLLAVGTGHTASGWVLMR